MYTSVIRKSARPISASGGTGVAKTAGVAKVAEAAAGDRADGGTRAEHAKQRSGGVQSIERAFTILETLAGNGGVMGLSALATESGLPLPTIHRLARTLVDLGYLRQEPSRQYALGPRILLLAESSSLMLSAIARPHLAKLVDDLGETANLASLDGDQIVYIAQVVDQFGQVRA